VILVKAFPFGISVFIQAREIEPFLFVNLFNTNRIEKIITKNHT